MTENRRKFKKNTAPKTPKPLDQATAFDYSLRLLGVRSRSIHELRTRMKQRGYYDKVIDDVVARLESYGYLNDENFANDYAKSRHRSGRSVGMKARMELKQKGIPSDQIDAAIDAAEDEVSQYDVVRDMRERRYKNFIYSEASEKERRKVVSFFLRRGFQPKVVMDVLRADPEDFGGEF